MPTHHTCIIKETQQGAGWHAAVAWQANPPLMAPAAQEPLVVPVAALLIQFPASGLGKQREISHGLGDPERTREIQKKPQALAQL